MEEIKDLEVIRELLQTKQYTRLRQKVAEMNTADIAVIFNWSPAEIFMMTPGEVVSWRERAALRSGNADNEDS